MAKAEAMGVGSRGTYIRKPCPVCRIGVKPGNRWCSRKCAPDRVFLSGRPYSTYVQPPYESKAKKENLKLRRDNAHLKTMLANENHKALVAYYAKLRQSNTLNGDKQ